MTLVLLAVLAAAATAFVLQPVFSGPETAPRRETDRNVLRLQEKRDQLLLTLAELDFEKDAGKIAPGEHAASRGGGGARPPPRASCGRLSGCIRNSPVIFQTRRSPGSGSVIWR